MVNAISGSIGTFYRSFFQIAEKAKEKKLVIYGAGYWGRRTISIFQNFGVKPVCLCDDDQNKIGEYIDGIKVVSLDEAQLYYPDAIYIAAAKNSRPSTSRREMNAKLRARGLLSKESGFHPFRYLFLELLDLEEESEIDFKSNLPLVKDIVILNQMGSSGVRFLDGLLDGHSEIMLIPHFGIWCDLPTVYRERLQYLEDEELCVEIMAQLVPAFLEIYMQDLEGKHIDKVLWQNYYIINKNGEKDTEVLIKNLSDMYKALKKMFMGKGKVSFGELLNGVFYSYYYATGRKEECDNKRLIIFHDHKNNVTRENYDDLFNNGENYRIIYCIREPLADCYSYLRFMNSEPLLREELFFLNRWKDIVADYIGCSCLDVKNLREDRVVRFENLKNNTEEALCELCKWLDIKWDSNLLKTTANGKEIYKTKKAPDGKISVVDGRSKDSIQSRDYSDMFTHRDIQLLGQLFSEFSRQYYPNNLVDIKELDIKSCELSFEGQVVQRVKEWYGQFEEIMMKRGFQIDSWEEFKLSFWKYVERCRVEVGHDKAFCEAIV